MSYGTPALISVLSVDLGLVRWTPAGVHQTMAKGGTKNDLIAWYVELVRGWGVRS
jgi:hypothetical protein